MYSFKNDYSEGAHERILEAISSCNLVQSEGYGLDDYTKEAINHIKNTFHCENSDIHFFSGGTQTNLTALSAFLRPHEAAISADTGHVLVHETGAIEATGHKVISVPSINGKLTSSQVESVLLEHIDEHMVKPKLVYISNPTEIGTIYTKKELSDLRDFCRKKGLILYLDGARLGSALTSVHNDISPCDYATLCDSFYIGGTKNGALLGEALVINKESLKSDFRYHMKQKGALLAKGRLISIQFLELFKDSLYMTLSSHANTMATKLSMGLKEMGIEFLTPSYTNQIFPILENSLIEKLQKEYGFYVWSKIDSSKSSIRLVTSWATAEEKVDEFIQYFKNCL